MTEGQTPLPLMPRPEATCKVCGRVLDDPSRAICRVCSLTDLKGWNRRQSETNGVRFIARKG